MAKIIYSEIEDCLDCPFYIKKAIRGRYGDARCWLYRKDLVSRAEERPTWCHVDSITVKLRKK